MLVSIPPNQLRLSELLTRFCSEVLKQDYYEVPESELRTKAEPIRQLLASGRLHARTMDGYTGKQSEIPMHSWHGSELWTLAARDAFEDGILVVSRDEVEQHWPITTSNVQTSPGTFSPPAYVPPFLEYMLELVKRFDLTPDYNFNRKAMAAFIMEDAPKELRGKEKARYMATFLGNPAHEGGGSPKTELPGQSERSADPLRDFQGTKYPKPRR